MGGEKGCTGRRKRGKGEFRVMGMCVELWEGVQGVGCG